jgi:MFS transporter, DHA1 family, multidrug resistance protein
MKVSLVAALALAFASFGDAFLYPFLPVNFTTVGVPIAWVGVLLSVNRFVRIISNTMMVHASARYGLRAVMIVAVLLAIVSTMGYGVATGIVVWVGFRIMWGLAFSAMRISTLAYAMSCEKVGVALGLTKSIQEAGPMLSLLAAPFLLQHFEARTIFFVLALCSAPALFFAWRLPSGDEQVAATKGKAFLQWPSALDATTLVSAMVIDGILVVVLGILFLHHREHVTLATATTLAAVYLGYRRICLVFLSATGGWLAYRLGINRIFAVSNALIILGLLTIVMGWVGTGTVLVFSFYSISAAITPGSLSSRDGHALSAVAGNATWRDIGAATGALLGGMLISTGYLNAVLIIAIFILIFLLLVHARETGVFKLLYLWR